MPLEQKWSDQSYSFPVDGRTEKQVEEMKEYGYVELPILYLCATCKWWEHRPRTMPENPSSQDGWCKRFDFPDRSYGCCGGWQPSDKAAIKKTALFK